MHQAPRPGRDRRRMIDEAYEAFDGTGSRPGISPCLSDFDSVIPLPLGDGTVGVGTTGPDN